MKLLDRRMQLVSLLLLLQGGAYYAVAFRAEVTPPVAPLATLPSQIGGWTMQQEFPMEKEVQDVLKADDTVSRLYGDGGIHQVSLFIAYFKTQRYGQAPHSPKNCLPGAGWEPLVSGPLSIAVSGQAEPIVSNMYVVARGEQKSVVIYWYQSHNRVIGSEYLAKFWLVVDAFRYRRSDTALVRFMVNVQRDDTQGALRTATEFVHAAFPYIRRQLPS
jgi:EpsI family protein